MPDQAQPIRDLPLAEDMEVVIDTGDEAVHVDAATGATEVTLPDGSVVVDISPPRPAADAGDFGGNLAERMDGAALAKLAEGLIEAIEADDRSRAEWMQTRARGMDLLGLRMEEPRGDVGTSSSPVEGMSVVRNSLLLEAVLTAQANARAELLPAAGPVKVVNEGRRTAMTEALADALEKDMNHYLTTKAREYYPDTDRMLLFTVFGGSGFKKVYRCPLRRRPVSESVDAADLIVSNAATDLRSASRVTHQSLMRPSVLKRMQHVGAYRDVPLTQPTPQPTTVERKEAEVSGIQPNLDRPEDQPYTIWECYCELDLPEFAPKALRGEGLALPYRVTLDKDSRVILEVRRNWSEDDPDCEPRTVFVQYPYIRGMGFYGVGLLHILGNTASALTAAEREMLDAGMFANFPGGLIRKQGTRQQSNEVRVAPGSFAPIDAGGGPISEAVMALPYKDVTPGLLALYDKVSAEGRRLGGIAEMKVGEGRQDAPVGTTIALIEQATKVESAVHKNMHQAQSEEFQLLADLFREDPEAFWRGNKRPATAWDQERFIAALDTYGLVPVADPNTPSHIHRIMKAVALMQLQQSAPQLYDPRQVHQRVLQVLGWDDGESMFAPPAPATPPPPDPLVEAKKIEAAQDDKELAAKLAIEAQKSRDKAADRKSKENIAVLGLAETLAIHETAAPLVERVVNSDGRRII